MSKMYSQNCVCLLDSNISIHRKRCCKAKRKCDLFEKKMIKGGETVLKNVSWLNQYQYQYQLIWMGFFFEIRETLENLGNAASTHCRPQQKAWIRALIQLATLHPGSSASYRNLHFHFQLCLSSRLTLALTPRLAHLTL